MRQAQTTITVQTRGVGLLEITKDIAGWLQGQNAQTGQITIFCRHTSASLTIQENADPDVQRDLVAFFNRLVPEGAAWFQHTSEGPVPPKNPIRPILGSITKLFGDGTAGFLWTLRRISTKIRDKIEVSASSPHD
ncbi:MAG: secondary thiamine-phosphate synthase enzyme YjbQ [Magnetococcus sp. YQC-5]